MDIELFANHFLFLGGGIGFAAGRSPIGPRVFVVALSRSSVFGFYSAIRQQVPKPMPVLVYEGAPLARTVNGDRYEALAE